MKERLEEIMRLEKLTSVKFAEILGVQPSNISHIMSGRNNPSYDFIIKFIERFPQVNTEWIITGKGDIYKSKTMNESIEVTDVKRKDVTLVNDDTFVIDTPKNEAIFRDNISLADDTFVTHNAIGEVNYTNKSTHAEQPVTDGNVTPLNTSASASEFIVDSQSKHNGKMVSRIILIYSDNSFEVLQN